MTDPTISVVIPTFQRRKAVTEAVRAFFDLEGPLPLEMIVVVDGSTDGTSAALRELDPPFPLDVVDQPNAGAGAARNRGAAQARGDVILFLDDDMIASPDIIQAHLRQYRAGADVVIGAYDVDPGSIQGFHTDIMERTLKALRQSVDHADTRAMGGHLHSGHFSVRREVFAALGGFDERLTANGLFAGEDTDLGTRLVKQSKVVFAPDAISHQRYVLTPGALMRRAPDVGRGVAAFVRANPELTDSYLSGYGPHTFRTRYIYRPIGRSRFVSSVLAKLTGPLADLVVRTPLRRNRSFGRIFMAVRSIAVWGEIERGLRPTVRQTCTVLAYHGLADPVASERDGKYNVPPGAFARQLDTLQKKGFNFVDPDLFVDWLGGKAELPPRALLLTFDDCYVDLAPAVRDILAPRGIPAIAFAVAGVASLTNEWDTARGAAERKLLDWTDLSQLLVHRLEIGSHAMTHRALPPLSREKIAEEIEGSIAMQRAAGLPPPRFFAYPFAEHDARSRDAVREAGLVAAFGVEPAKVDRFSDRYALPRVEIYARDQGWKLLLKVSRPGLHTRLIRFKGRWS